MEEPFDCSFATELILPLGFANGRHMEEVCLGGEEDHEDGFSDKADQANELEDEYDEGEDTVPGQGSELHISRLPPAATEDSLKRVCQAFGLQVIKVKVSSSDAQVLLGPLAEPEGSRRTKELSLFLEGRTGCIVTEKCDVLPSPPEC